MTVVSEGMKKNLKAKPLHSSKRKKMERMMKVIIAGTDDGEMGFLDGRVKELLALVSVEVQVELVSTSDGLVERVRGGGYDLAFIYYSLGESGGNGVEVTGSGVEATRRIREFDGNTLIHLIGGYSAARAGAVPPEQMRKEALGAGANGYVPTAYPKEIDEAIHYAVRQFPKE